MNKLSILILGSKEYPMGTNKGDDPLPSGGIEVYVDYLVKEFSKRNVSTKIITRKFKGTERYERRGTIEIYRVPWIKGFYFRNISFNFFSFLKALRVDFDIIFVNDLIATLFGFFLSKIKRKPLISLVHGTAFHQPQYNRILKFSLKKLEGFTYSKPDFLVSISENVRENFRKNFGFLPKNWDIIPMGMDLKKFEKANGDKVRQEFNLAKDVLIVTFIGRLIKVKGTEYLIEAVANIKRGNFVVLIVGTGPDESRLKKLVHELNFQSRIIFTGFREDIADILAATSVYVLPSFSEGLCISLLEAKASGCASVVTNIGLDVENGRDALVVPPGDATALGKAIERLLENKEFREKLGKNAKEVALKKYLWETAIKKYMEIFEKLIK